MLTQDRNKVRPKPITQAIETLKYLHPDGAVFEVCVIGPKTSNSNLWEGRAGGKKPIVAGWFKDPVMAAELAVQIVAEGIYTTLNPCQEALLARANHRLKAHADRTADQNISGIKNFLIDIDPSRPTGISSTGMEHEAALEMARIIQAGLAKEGWPESLVGDSGNGAHLVYPLALANTPENVELVKATLLALAQRFQEQLAAAGLELDQAVFNPARLTKLYGTMARKGDDTQDRPHRMAQIISLPEVRRPICLELLQKLAETVHSQGPSQAQIKEPSEGCFDLGAYLAHYAVEVVRVKPHGGGLLYCLEKCLFDPSHSGNEAAIWQAADGKLYYQCFHSSCKGRTWPEARQKISGGAKLTEFIVGTGASPPAPKPPAPDYDRAERAAIQAEARAPDHKRTLVLRTGLTTAVAEGLRAAGVAEDVISQAVNIVEQSEGPKGGYNLSAEVRDWVLSSNGVFYSSDVVRELGLSSLSSDRNFNKNLSKILERLVKEGHIERHGDRRGCFRRIERESEEIDFLKADPTAVLDLKWPFELEKLVHIYPKNIIVVAGDTGAGKTALLLNVVRLNMNSFPVIYLSSEMGPEELRLRLEKFPMPLTAWNFKPFERASNFADAIVPGAVNIVDYLELTEDFYKVAREIKKIFDRLTTGVAVIAIQKKQGAVLGRGGDFSMEKSRLYLSMDAGELKILKGKNWAQPGVNPKGTVFRFKLVDGCNFSEV
jgi:hypothetical protein